MLVATAQCTTAERDKQSNKTLTSMRQIDKIIERWMISRKDVSCTPFPCYKSLGSSRTVGCNGVARSIGSPSSSSRPNTSFSVGTGPNGGTEPNNSRSAASRAVDEASSARNLQPKRIHNPISRERQMKGGGVNQAAPDAFFLDE
jgi:hypothetical protein